MSSEYDGPTRPLNRSGKMRVTDIDALRGEDLRFRWFVQWVKIPPTQAPLAIILGLSFQARRARSRRCVVTEHVVLS